MAHLRGASCSNNMVVRHVEPQTSNRIAADGAPKGSTASAETKQCRLDCRTLPHLFFYRTVHCWCAYDESHMSQYCMRKVSRLLLHLVGYRAIVKYMEWILMVAAYSRRQAFICHVLGQFAHVV